MKNYIQSMLTTAVRGKNYINIYIYTTIFLLVPKIFFLHILSPMSNFVIHLTFGLTSHQMKMDHLNKS